MPRIFVPALFAPAVFAVAIFGTLPAFADDNDCGSPMSQWQPREAAIEHVKTFGIEASRVKVDDGCYELRGRDIDGNRVELKLDPATLAVVELEIEFRPGADAARYLSGAQAMSGAPAVQAPAAQAPAANPLFTPGSKPKVNAN